MQQLKDNTEHHLLNMKYLESDPHPSKEKLKKMYGYLDYCNSCGKKIRFLELYTHGFGGNCHKFGCSIFARGFGLIFGITSGIIKIPIIIVVFPFYFLFKKIKGEKIW